jgi:hypothetical protein
MFLLINMKLQCHKHASLLRSGKKDKRFLEQILSRDINSLIALGDTALQGPVAQNCQGPVL